VLQRVRLLMSEPLLLVMLLLRRVLPGWGPRPGRRC